MKFTIEVEQNGRTWWEEYDEDTDDAQKWGADIVQWFNDTAQPGATTRKFLSAKVLDLKSIKDHDWSKQNLMTLTSPQGFYDRLKCSVCSIVARRYGLTRVVRQNPYRAKKFERCDSAIKALEARRKTAEALDNGKKGE